MKEVLLYGDSFFWGVDASSGGRHRFEDQIGALCQKVLGNDYNVITEGLRGRTMFGENGWFPERDGLVQFGPIFASHLPLDVVVIMLGTNDLNTRTQHNPSDTAAALLEYREKMKFWCEFMKYELPKVIVIAPPAIDEAGLTAFKDIFEGCGDLVPELAKALNLVCKEQSFEFLNGGEVIVSSGMDGIHIDANQNAKLAAAIAEAVKSQVD